ncbi:MAG: hypothetical protein D6730_20300 [Bacteroidetes bacterium]|nr:MAG: hypothetical protein D6730_20300 [Bacteroidota bacterium]
MNKHLILALICLITFPAFGQIENKYEAYFTEAYRKYPRIPRGVLEAVAYTNTRIRHLQPDKEPGSCQGLPAYYGVMGLVEDGKGYFRNNLAEVAKYSGFRVSEIKRDPRINILAYAAAYDAVQRELRMSTTRSMAAHAPIITRLSEIPQDRSVHNAFALDQQFYAILKEMQEPHVENAQRSREAFNFEEIFKENYKVLSAPGIKISDQGIRNLNNEPFLAPAGTEPPACTQSNNATDYAGAIWVPAHPRNYGSRNGEQVEFVTIHTIQGSYASAISWFKNPNARVSAHYIIRASDGQVTQMVCESQAGYHVRTDNSRAIGIEHEGFIDEGEAWYTTAMYESSARLVRDICRRHNINPLQTFGGPPTNGVKPLGNKCYKIKGHQHFRGNDHVDPGPFWDWDRYYRLINDEPTPLLYTKKKGTLLDPGGERNYGDQMRVTYLIKPEGATAVRLEFEEFELEGSETTPYDYLDIYDGENAYAPFIGRFTGNKIPQVIIAKSGAVFMEFRSDCQINKAGWKLSYSATRRAADCPVPQALQASNIFPMGATLSWQGGPQADHYLLYVKKRNLEEEWDKYRTSATSVTLTGLGANSEYQWEVQAVCGADTSGLVGDVFTTPGVSQKGSPRLYRVSLNSGKFYDSGGKNAGYINNEAYIYQIAPPNGKRIELTFEEFDTEACCDFLVVYDGPSINAPLIDTLAGSRLPKTIVSTGNTLTLLFTSDERTTGKGWAARWRTIGDATGPPVTDNDSQDDNEPVTDDNEPGPLPDTGPFEPKLVYASTAPETRPRLNELYTDDFTLQFDDIDKSGRGLANRFYNIAENTPAGWRSNPEKGFFYDDFNRGLHPDWKIARGSWQVRSGRLIQTDASEGNSNIYTELRQRNEVYVYHWQGRISGSASNKRMGLHFFCSDPAAENRGNSYFVWIRDAADGDKVEIYKTWRNKFDLKVRRNTTINTGEVYDYKVIYNPRKGRIELYINNKFAISYNDPAPLRTGSGISLRTGDCIAEFDNLIVYKTRGRSVNLSLGPEPNNDIRMESPRPGEQAFRVHSLIVDRNIRWSPVGTAGARVSFGGGLADEGSGGSSSSGSSGSGTDDQYLKVTYNKDFSFTLPQENSYYLVADYDGKRWSANPMAGFFLDEFSGSSLRSDWTPVLGSWRVSAGVLEQQQENSTNSNVYVPLRQQANQSYLYHFRARLLTTGENKRFGFHFFASDGKLTNRGNSYLVWFRNKDQDVDKVEVYRSNNNQLGGPRESAIAKFQPNRWYDIKITLDNSSGLIEVFLDNLKVLSWRDSEGAFSSGQYISFRTGNARAQFDDLRVYQRSPSRTVLVSVGKQDTDMIRYRSQGNLPAGRIYMLGQYPPGRWSEVSIKEAVVE